MKSVGKRREVLHISWCLLHQFLPVLFGYLCISQVEKNVSELHLLCCITCVRVNALSNCRYALLP